MARKQARGLSAFHADDDISRCPFGSARCLPGPERLVALGFRYWMRGRIEGSVTHWERAWNLYSGLLGVADAQVAVGRLSRWVGAISDSCARNIEVSSEECRSFCRDECIAVSIIAACQHNTCPALRACAFALVESSSIDGVVGGAQAFADTMSGFNQVLSPRSIIAAPVFGPPASQRLQ